MAINVKYSHKDFSGMSFINVDPEEFNNSEIIGSCFHQHNKPFSDIFPSSISGVTFTQCNLDNCNIPAGATLVKSTNLQIEQFEGQDYVLDQNGFRQLPLEEYLQIAFWRDI